MARPQLNELRQRSYLVDEIKKLENHGLQKIKNIPGYNARVANANAVKILNIESRVLTRLTIKKNKKC